MAWCRCISGKTSKPKKYTCYVLPAGYPDSSLVCGRCEQPGVIWLRQDEKEAYEKGTRLFTGIMHATKMRAGQEGIIQPDK